MASKQDIVDLKKTIQELRKANFNLQLRVEELESRVTALENGEVSGTKVPEAILTCVQCTDDYKESENAEGSCLYHSESLVGHGWDFKYACCGKGSRNYDSAKTIVGCVKGKHRSKHHTDYHYSRYVFYMQEQSKQAKEIWLEMDVEDLVTNCCEWAEVGLSSKGEFFVLAGISRIKCTAIAVYSGDELHNLKGNSVIAFEVTDPVGWSLKAELLVNNETATAVVVSIKPASSSEPVVKQLEIEYNETGAPMSSGRKPEVLSDPSPKQGQEEKLPEQVKEGPILDPGQDYSTNRKNDYPAEYTGDCPFKLQQHGKTEVNSSFRNFDGKWNNLFSCTVKVTNPSKEKLSVTDAYGEYMNKESKWVKCDEIFIGKEFFRGNYDWFDTPNFSLPEGSTVSLLVRLCIKFADDPPSNNIDGRRAHPSLPQPLHLRFTFIDQNDDTVSLRFEQGNKPLDLATRERRIEGWCEKKEENLLFWIFADDCNARKRSDAAVYFDDNGIVCYRSAVDDSALNTYYVSPKQKHIGFQAKSTNQKEFFIDEWKKEVKGTSISPYALVNLETATMYGMKIVVITPTSKTVDSFQLPNISSAQGTLSVSPEKVIVKGNVKVNWSVSRASSNDSIYVFPVNGRSNVTYVKNKGLVKGESSFKAPSVPGEYEARYYPASLQGQYHGYRHNQYIAVAKFTVTGV